MNPNLIKMVQDNVADLQALITIKSIEEFEYFCVPGTPFENSTDKMYSIGYIATLISLRFETGRFTELLDGLESTMNIFGKFLIIVTKINDKIFALIVPRKEKLDESYYNFRNIVGKIKESNLL